MKLKKKWRKILVEVEEFEEDMEDKWNRYRNDSVQISLLVPFKADIDSPHRLRVWKWLREYWEQELPDAEIIIGRTRARRGFSKTEAVNNAAQRAHGRVFVILDSDAYISGDALLFAAKEIEVARNRGHHLWFVPYQNLYRLTEQATEQVLLSEPHNPLRFPTPPDPKDVASSSSSETGSGQVGGSEHGRRFGAMCQVMSREAFYEVGGMDERFRGWGGEDIAFLRAVDTLFGKHRTTPNDILHLWHPSQGKTFLDRMWQGQDTPRTNENLASRYNRATGDRVKMRELVDESNSKRYLKNLDTE